MRIAMTLVVDDDADVLEAHFNFHLSAGVDLVVVNDNGSSAATAGILERYERTGAVHVMRQPAEESRERRITGMARAAVTEHGADWVIASDAADFWWPRGGSLKEVLEQIPSEFGIVQAFVRHFVPVAGGEGLFAERMIYRLSPHAPIHDPASPWRPFPKVVARAESVGHSDTFGGPSLRPLRGWYPIEVLHFPIRSSRQLEPTDSAYLPFDPANLERSLAEGVVQIDTRLRDALRTLGNGTVTDLAFPRPTVIEDVQFAVDAAVIGEADVLRTQSRMDLLEQRLGAIERYAAVRFERRARSLVRRWRRPR
jgi:hypothetical protein